MRRWMTSILIICSVFIGLSPAAVGENDSTLPMDWFKRALKDLDTAEEMMKKPDYYDQVCFLSHQATEKFIKGRIYEMGNVPQKTHNIESLFKKAFSHSKTLAYLQDDLIYLDSVYITSRYPSETEYSEEDADRCLNVARGMAQALVGG